MKPRKRIYFLNRFYWPDTSATAQILTSLAEHLSEQGWDVYVLTSRLYYADNTKILSHEETNRRVKIKRLWSTRFGRGNLIGRAFDYLTIYISFAMYLLAKVEAESIVVAKTDPPLLSIPGSWIKSIKQFKLVSWCQDLFPEVAEVGLPTGSPGRKILKMIRELRNQSLHDSDMIAVLSTDMKRLLQENGVSPSKIKCLANWAIQDQEGQTTEKGLRSQWGLEGKFIFGYSGNLGRVHDWKTVFRASELVRGHGICFVVIGGGHGYEHLKAAVFSAGIEEEFRFLPYQTKELLGSTLKVPHLHWISLLDEMTPLIVPSKFYGILDAGRPLIFIGDPEAGIARQIEESGCGFVCRVGEAEFLATILKKLSANMAEVEEMGLNASRLSSQSLSQDNALSSWHECLHQLRES